MVGAWRLPIIDYIGGYKCNKCVRGSPRRFIGFFGEPGSICVICRGPREEMACAIWIVPGPHAQFELQHPRYIAVFECKSSGRQIVCSLFSKSCKPFSTGKT